MKLFEIFAKRVYNNRMLIESSQTDETIELLKNAIKGSEFDGKLFIAGGFVRDTLLGRNSKDIDIVVDGGPTAGLDAATFIAKKLGVFKQDSNPVLFPTYFTAKLSIKTSTGPMEVEFVAPRTEKYTPGSRKPEVVAGTLKDDVFRRDFTVNSLLQNLQTGEIIDMSGRGLKDLKAGVLNTTGNPDFIFSEDPLRILRAVRFAIKYKFTLPLNVIKAIKKAAPSLKNISAERINDEISKILVLNNPSKAFELFRITGIMDVILPELKALDKLKQNKFHNQDALGHTLTVLDKSSPELIKRLAALFHDCGKASTRTEKDGKVQFIGHESIGADIARVALKRLKYPTDVIDKVCSIIQHHMYLKSAGPDGTLMKDSTLRKFIFRVSNNLEDALDVINADNNAHAEGHGLPDQINMLRKRIQQMDINQILNTKSILDGNEIMTLGAKGRLIGEIKNKILDATLKNPNFSRHDAEVLAKNIIRAQQK
jgi:poly(A) polymerase